MSLADYNFNFEILNENDDDFKKEIEKMNF